MTPKIFETIVRQLPLVALDVPTGEDRFTVREVVAHMADWEGLFRARMQTAYANPGNHVVPIDEGERAIEMNYAQSDIWSQLRAFEEQRGETILFLEDLEVSDWTRYFLHPELGTMTIAEQNAMLAGHDIYHIEQLTKFGADLIAQR